MTDKAKSKFEELNLTKDELERLTEAMKKEEFRKLLVEYAEEISDPKNRELYEKEIAQLEKERGMNVTFINPEPGFCMKTTENGEKKCFINICKNSNVDKPSSSMGPNKAGLYWSIPHTCSPPREDVDKTGKQKCTVYDVVFHPDAYRMGETNQRFNQLLKDTAFDSIEKNFNVKLDRVNCKLMKNLNFKGRPTATVIRKQDPNFKQVEKEEPAADDSKDMHDQKIDSIVDQLKKQYIDDQVIKSKSVKNDYEKNNNKNNVIIDEKENVEYTVPKYEIINRGQADIQDCATEIPNGNSRFVQSTRPKELIVKIDLPLCKSSELISLDIFEKQLILKSTQPNYLLDIKLPYPVNEKESKAKFDKTKRCLNLTLSVIPFVEKVSILEEENKVEEIDQND